MVRLRRAKVNYMNSSKEDILNKIRAGKALHRPSSILEPEWDSLVFPEPINLVDTFVDELTQLFGKVTLVAAESEFVQKLSDEYMSREWSSIFCLDKEIDSLLKGSSIQVERDLNKFLDVEVAITQCELLVARSGTIVISSKGDSGRRMNVYPPIHLVYGKASQLVPFLKDAIAQLEQKYGGDYPSLISFVTGASRTADIEKTLVFGAHGPKELHLFLNINS